MSSSARKSLGIAGIYLASGVVWIGLSDALVALLHLSPDMVTRFALFKGTVFVLFSSVALFVVLKRYFEQLEVAHKATGVEGRHARERLENLQTLYDVSEILTQVGDLADKADKVAAICVDRLEARLAWIGEAMPDGSVRFLAHYPKDAAYPSDLSVRWDDSPEGNGPTGLAIRTGKPSISNDIAGDPRFAPWKDRAIAAGYGSSGVFCLADRGQIFGALAIYGGAPDFFTPARVLHFEALARQAASSLETSRLFMNLKEKNEALVRSYDSTIEALSLALDLKDRATKWHSLRVTELTLRLARSLGLPEEQLVHIRRGALLHDIGKIGIPDRILFKEGSLDDGERVIMRRHTIYAKQLLSGIDYLAPALEIPLAHHERWDGQGYPEGLSGREIPLSARIFAIADVFDALTSERPYHKAISVEMACDELRKGAGSHFDPELVERFLALVRDGSLLEGIPAAGPLTSPFGSS